jgi:hypothetical protein
MADPAGRAAPPPGGDPTSTRVVKVSSDERRPLLFGGIVVVAILALAVLKPWGAPGDSGQAADAGLASSAPADAPASPVPTPSATPPGLGVPSGQCFPGTDWRVYALQVDEGRLLQHWLSIEPVSAADPRDPAVPFVGVVTDRLLALGFCVGSRPDGLPSLTGVRAWALRGGPAVPIVLDPLVAYMPHEPDLGAVFRPPTASPAPSSAAVAVAWPPGRYVFAVREGSTDGGEWWFGVEIDDAPEAPAKPESSTPP